MTLLRLFIVAEWCIALTLFSPDPQEVLPVDLRYYWNISFVPLVDILSNYDFSYQKVKILEGKFSLNIKISLSLLLCYWSFARDSWTGGLENSFKNVGIKKTFVTKTGNYQPLRHCAMLSQTLMAHNETILFHLKTSNQWNQWNSTYASLKRVIHYLELTEYITTHDIWHDCYKTLHIFLLVLKTIDSLVNIILKVKNHNGSKEICYSLNVQL